MSFASGKPSNDKLFHGDAFVERMFRIEQHGQRLAAVHRHRDAADIADFLLVADRAHRPFFGVEHPDADLHLVRQDRALPAARPERADRGQRQQIAGQRQDRAIGGQIIGGGAGRGGDQDTVADQFFHHDPAVDLDLELGRLPGLAQQRHLVDRGQGEIGAGDGLHLHFQGLDLERPGLGQALAEVVHMPVVHQEADGAEVHAVDRHDCPAVEHLVQGLQHEAVAAQNHGPVGFLQRHPVDHGFEFFRRFLSWLRRGHDQCPFLLGHPPVTFM